MASGATFKSVAAVNGFLGDRLGLDVSDVVNPRALSDGRNYYTSWRGRPARGGAGIIAKRRFYRWCRKHKGEGILFVGKSFGAHWILDAIEKLDIGHCSESLLFDPSCRLLREERRAPRRMHDASGVTVVRQLGPRSGYRVKDAKDIVIDAKHSNIERTKEGRGILDDWLKERGL